MDTARLYSFENKNEIIFKITDENRGKLLSITAHNSKKEADYTNIVIKHKHCNIEYVLLDCSYDGVDLIYGVEQVIELYNKDTITIKTNTLNDFIIAIGV